MGAFPNKRAGRCDVCGAQVAEQAGLCYRNAEGRWAVVCGEGKCAEEVGARECKRLLLDGRLMVPYELRDVCKALPGARWDGSVRAWRVSLAQSDRLTLLDACRRHGIEVPEELQKLDESTAEAESELLDKRLYPFQAKGVLWLRQRARALLADDMGCVDGEAVIHVNRCLAGKRLKLADLYAHWQRWNKTRPTFVRVLTNDGLHQHQLLDVIDKGTKEVWQLSTSGGRTIRLTPDHEVMLANQDFVRADSLSVGDKLLCNGRPACIECGATEKLVTYRYAKFLGYCRSCAQRYRRNGHFKTGKCLDQDGYIRLSGLRDHPRRTTGGVYEHIVVAEQMLGRSIGTDEVVHHKNGIKTDNRPENLQVVSLSEHQRIHGRASSYRNMNRGTAGRGGEIWFVPEEDTVSSIGSDGIAHVYDLVCAEPYHNFVASGFIVHNCGKTVQVLQALPEKARCLLTCPSSLKLNWRDEVQKWRPDLVPVVCKGLGTVRSPAEGEVVIANYEILPKLAKRDPDRASGHMRAWAEFPLDLAGVTMVVDEATYCKSGKAQRTKIVRAAAHRAERVWLLSGTPLMSRPSDLWNVLNTGGMATEVFGSWGEFVRAFNGRRNHWGGFEYGEPRRDVPERLRRVMLRRRKAEVLPELPRIVWQKVPIEIEDTKLVSELDEAWASWRQPATLFGEELPSELPPFERFSEILAKLSESRIPMLLQLVEHAEEADEPLLVFSAHRSPIEALRGRPGWGIITGDDSPVKRHETVRAFQARELRGVGLTIQAGGYGLTLTRASHVILCSQTFTPAETAQAIDRCRRIGSTAESILVTVLVSDHILDRHVLHILDEKRALIDAAIERVVGGPCQDPRPAL